MRLLAHVGRPRGRPGPFVAPVADTGASATPPELRRPSQPLPGAQVRVFYGSTEAGGVAMLEDAEFRRKPGSCGVPGPFT